ncbi:MAG: dUTP diphosphatase [Oscillospiraceae bacterium]|jgi:dUTP pyrophosphatase|nr:dUTP diphosphatase [Oscillospiraceae bacterium]
MTDISISFKLLRDGARAPVYSTDGAAGADLYACIDAPIEIGPGGTAMIGMGFAAAVPEGYVGLVFARSGMASGRGLAPANKVGVVDSDYRGEWMVPLHNHGSAPAAVLPGERVAQFLLVPVARAKFVESEFLDATSRGTGGFGSTGK